MRVYTRLRTKKNTGKGSSLITFWTKEAILGCTEVSLESSKTTRSFQQSSFIAENPDILTTEVVKVNED